MMNIDHIVSIRNIDGFTSARCYDAHVLTSSPTGVVSQWDIETSNPILSHSVEKTLDFVLPYRIDNQAGYDRILLQTNEDISLLDINSRMISRLADVVTSSFARVSLLNYGSGNTPCIIVPCEKSIKIFDLRIESGGVCSNITHAITPPVIKNPPKNEIGMLHTCRQFSALGDPYILSTYESASIVIHDLRNLKEPIFPVHFVDTLEAIPALSIWNNIILIGDTGGIVHMYHITHQNGVCHLKSSNTSNSLEHPGISSLDIRNDGSSFIAGCWDRVVRIFETRSLSLKSLINKHSSSIIDVSFNEARNVFCTASKDGCANVFSVS